MKRAELRRERKLKWLDYKLPYNVKHPRPTRQERRLTWRKTFGAK